MKQDRVKHILVFVLAICLLAGTVAGCKNNASDAQTSKESTFVPISRETAPKETEPIPQMVGYVNVNALNIRSGPGAGYQLLGKYVKDDYVRIYEIDGKWGKTEIGWIYIQYVTAIQEEPTQPQKYESEWQQ